MSTIRQGFRAEQMSLSTIRQGFLAGLFAGLIATLFFFVDGGPGTGLHRVASWISLDNEATGHFVGFLLVLLLGSLFGILFSVVTRNWQPELGRWLLTGLAIGAIWWIVVVLAIGTGLSRVPLTFAGGLSSSVLLLLYGLLLGSISYQWKRPNTETLTRQN